MKTKRILALAIAVLMIVSCFASCRTKDENAFTFTYGDKSVSIRTALYMCFIIDADVKFQSEATTAADEKGTEYEDYKELTYEDKDYVTWTKDEAKAAAEKYAYAEIEFDRLGFTISDEDQAYIDYYADSQWNGDNTTMGVGEIYEANGISFNTYKMYFTNSYFKQEMVYNFYVEEVSEKSEEESTTATSEATETTTKKKLDPEIEKLRGSLRPADKDINSALEKNFVPVNVIEVSFLDDEGNEKDDATKKTQLSMLKDFAKQINEGTDFATVYANYQVAFGLAADASSVDVTSAASEYEQVLMSAQANKNVNSYDEADENFTEAYKLETGKATVVENDDCYVLVMRKDVLKDSDSNDNSFKDSYFNSAIKVLVNDEYEADFVEKMIKEMKCDENASAIKFYTADKIDYLDETTEASETATEYAE